MDKTLKNIAMVAVLAALPFVVSGCPKNETDDDTTSLKKAEVKPVEEKKIEIVVEEDNTPPEAYVLKIRNPFRSPYAGKKSLDKEERDKVPLENYELSTLKIIAIVIGTGGRESIAMVRAEDNKTYTVRKKDRIGVRDGYIVKIHDNGIVVSEEDPVTGERVDVELLAAESEKGKGSELKK
ncbi:MAG: pilus assembly protein PilP [Deltaproteobacteria bacterium]|nr:pilus assembly protein PilP [Deltaproteobacteria bacterium]